MSILSKLAGGAVEKPIEAVGNVLDKAFTSDEERIDKHTLLLRILQNGSALQTEINKIEAQSKHFIQWGWRPAIGWVCVVALAYNMIIQPLLGFFMDGTPDVNDALLFELVFGMLGMGALRSFEKYTGRAK